LKHVGFVGVTFTLIGAGWLIVNVLMDWQPLASVTIEE
jgi:hypothetical protein